MSVACWGYNASGQLGDGTNTDKNIPVIIGDLVEGVLQVSSGGEHTCAIGVGGAVDCWGQNDNGQLGNGTNANSNIPVRMHFADDQEIVTITTGLAHTCALSARRAVLCWGRNVFGQLGDGTNGDRLAPVEVAGLSSGVKAISAGNDHTCALKDSGAVTCWGWNAFGQLGDGTNLDQNVLAAEVIGLPDNINAISAGGTATCAVTKNDEVLCWGRNSQGQLGNGTTTDSNVPVSVDNLSAGLVDISAGFDHACALLDGGEVMCWGLNVDGRLGNGTNVDTNVPLDAVGLSGGFRKVSAGGSQTCALPIDGSVVCWGWNGLGNLGDGTTNNRNSAEVPAP